MIEVMFSFVHDDVRQAVADQLEIELDDLELLDHSETSYTFRQVSTRRTHTAEVVVGPEGPVITVIV